MYLILNVHHNVTCDSCFCISHSSCTFKLLSPHLYRTHAVPELNRTAQKERKKERKKERSNKVSYCFPSFTYKLYQKGFVTHLRSKLKVWEMLLQRNSETKHETNRFTLGQIQVHEDFQNDFRGTQIHNLLPELFVRT